MPSDYEQISRKNEKKYGTDVGRFGPRLLGDLYAERAHFVFELLQNAEDALNRRGGPGGSRSVRFEVPATVFASLTSGFRSRMKMYGRFAGSPRVRRKAI